MTRRAGASAPGAPAGVPRWRVSVLFAGWCITLALLLCRLVDLQVFQAQGLQRIAIRQQLGSLRLPGRRGAIVDRGGRPLALNVPVDSLYAVPRAIPDPAAFARAIAPALRLTPAEVEARLRRGGPHFAWLARRQPPHTIAAVRALGLGDAVGVLTETQRVYPAGELAASTIGFAGMDGSGLAGLEMQYDAVLRGVEGLGTAHRDAIGRELVQTQRILTPPHDGNTLVLTLDEVIQHIAERELRRAVAAAGAQGGVAIVMDPNTGAIFALATLPSFDPNRFQETSPEVWRNRAVADVYEPGSPFKLILAAAALSSGAVSPGERFPDPGMIRVNGAWIHDAEVPAHPTLTLAEIVKYSSNVGAAEVASRLGRDRFSGYIRRFGFGRPTGIDLPGEAAGIIRPVEQWFGPSLQNIGFGQGISVTPIQLLVAASALTTHGLSVHPHLVEAVRDPAGHTIDTPGALPPQPVIEPEVADRVLAMMREVVQGGSGEKAGLPGYPVAGKTGTAQRPRAGGGYEPGAYEASFVGAVPVPSPRIAVLVIVDRPGGVYTGGDVAAPPFREIARQVLWYLRVPPVDGPE
ncbi:MAG: penicillin-binding protein [Bacillati bacterium ANGP1]|uniref:Penicillin-binding protein n=1 Tax=Candidatus Segetimicrobium genomatis TaxID=2569760 RepID=A0A537JXF1_9BACT|nr:MAG: penicillin-binding protein [Terrabacteria group bacterium ANGP1]